MSRAVEAALAEHAAAQHGVVTRRQALEAGLTPCMLQRRLASGRLQLLHRGVYLTLPFALPRTREMAAVLAGGRGALLCFISAGSLWNLRPAVDGRVHVSVMGHRGDRSGICAHRLQDLSADKGTVQDSIPVTTPARTLLDLATVLGLRELEAAVARAERAGQLTPEVLAALLARHARHRGGPALRRVLALAGGPALTRSEAEELFLALVCEAGLPRPECNVNLGPYEVDFLWRVARLAVEVDGFRYHSSRRSFEGDRQKDAWLVAAGFTVLRLSWRQITEERVATAVLVARALDRANHSELTVG